MKKAWNRVIIISFIILALVACGTIFFLYPYYNKYRVFDGIEAGRWEDVKKSYDALSEAQQAQVQKILPYYAKYIYAEYVSGEKDYTYTAAAYDAINSIDETQKLSDEYLNTINYVEYKRAIDAQYESTKFYDNRGQYDAKDTIAGINKRIDTTTRETILIEILNEKYLSYLKQEISAQEVKSYNEIVGAQAFYAAKEYTEVINSNIDCVENYRKLYTVAQKAYDDEDYFTAILMCQSVILDPDDATYLEKYYTLYSLAYATGMNYYDNLLDVYIERGDNKNAVALMKKIDEYYYEDIDLTAKRLKMATDWQKAYVEIADNLDAKVKDALTESQIDEASVSDLKADSLLLKDLNEDGIPEAFFFDSEEENDVYTTCYIFGFDGENAVFLGCEKLRSFCKNNSFVVFPWDSTKTSGEEYGLKVYTEGVLEDGSYCQDVDGSYYVDNRTVNEIAYLSARSEILENSIEQGITDFDFVSLDDSESYILAY